MKSNLKKVEEMYLLHYFASHSALGIAICKIAYGKRHFCGLASNLLREINQSFNSSHEKNNKHMFLTIQQYSFKPY